MTAMYVPQPSPSLRKNLNTPLGNRTIFQDFVSKVFTPFPLILPDTSKLSFNFF